MLGNTQKTQGRNIVLMKSSRGYAWKKDNQENQYDHDKKSIQKNHLKTQ